MMRKLLLSLLKVAIKKIYQYEINFKKLKIGD